MNLPSSLTMKVAGFVIFLSLVVCLAKCDNPSRDEKKSKSVTTLVSAKWEATPLVLELAEYLAGESSDLFWSFIDGINSLKDSLDTLGKYQVPT